MKTFKTIDFWINVILISLYVVVAILEKTKVIHGYGEFIVLGYFIVGGWQVISMITHCTNGWFMEKKMERSNYHKFTVVAIILMITMFWFFILLWIAPFLALFYTWICYNETFVKMKRPLADWA